MNCRKVSALTDLGRRGAGHPVSLLPPPREALGDLVALRHLQHHVPKSPLQRSIIELAAEAPYPASQSVPQAPQRSIQATFTAAWKNKGLLTHVVLIDD